MTASTRPLEPSEVALNQARADNARAEAEHFAAQARKEAALAATAELELAAAQRKEAKELAKDEHHHTWLFDKEVNESTVKACVAQLATWERSAEEPITVELVINSPGGSVFDGFALIDYIDRMHQNGHTVNTTAYGMAASMAGVILQVGRTRAIGANALMLIHEASFGAIGSFGKVEDQVKMVELMHDRILTLFASRSKMTKATISRRWRRRDWWLNADECLRHGFVDAIR